MNKITIKKIPFKLSGNMIEKDNVLFFQAIDKYSNKKSINDYEGRKIISVFPDINTRVCDAQTQQIAKWATQYPNIKFISITMDSIEVINAWCASHGINNIDVLSDRKLMQFGKATNLFIPKIKKLARGFIVLDKENKIIDLFFKKELSSQPNYEAIETFFK